MLFYFLPPQTLHKLRLDTIHLIMHFPFKYWIVSTALLIKTWAVLCLKGKDFNPQAIAEGKKTTK